MLKKGKNTLLGFIIIALFTYILSLVVPPANFSPTPVNAEGGFTFVTTGDYGYNSIATATLNKIKELNPAFSLTNGDLSYDEITPESAWCSYVKGIVGETFPFEIVAGNHEAGDPPGGHIDNFTPCLPHRMDNISGTYGWEYYFDHQNARFIQISPGMAEGPLLLDYSLGSSHYNWTANAIDSARAKGIKWIIVTMHENCITMGDKTCDIGPDILNLLIEKKVDLIFQGHDHTYQRSKQLAFNPNCPRIIPGNYNSNCVSNTGSNGAYAKGAGSILNIVGTAGAGLYTVNTADSEAGYFAKWMGSNNQPRHGLVKVTVTENQLVASFVGSTTESSFTDSYTITDTSVTPTPSSSVAPTATPIPTFTPIRLTTGNNYTDPSNNQWNHDASYADGGSTYTTTNTIANTTTPKLYQSERYGKDINYGFNVPNGTYEVKVKFSEIYFTQAGERIFNLNLNGNLVLENFDILSEVAPFSALDKTFTVNVTDQKINLDFSTTKDNAKLAALEITRISGPSPTVSPTPSPSVSPTATPTPSFTPIRLNTGTTTVDTQNQTWISDNGKVSGGTTYTVNSTIANTSNQKLFQSERYGNTFNYTFTVPNGNYTVNLNFSEIYFTQAGERIFNVDINGNRVLSNYDILAQTAPYAAVTKSFPATVTDGKIVINFTTVKDNAKIASLEIVSSSGPTTSPTASPSPTPTTTPTPTPTTTPTPTPTFSPIRLNTGTSVLDTQNNTWSTDTAQNAGGETYTVNNTIANTANPKLFQSERYGQTLTYNFTVPNGSYNLNLNLSEIYFTQAGERIFNVDINGTRVLSNFDILTQVAPFTALTKSFPVTVTNGKIQIVFTTIKDNAKLASLEIVPATNPTATPQPTITPTPTVTPTPSTTATPTPTPTTTPTPVPSGVVNGLNATYYDNMDFTGTSVTRIDPQVYFDWMHGAPTPSMGTDTFSARWTGFIVPNYSENYTFYTDSDDGVRVWINNVLIIDKWIDQGVTEHSGSIVLQANQKYAVKVEYYDNSGGASCKLRWSSVSQVKQTVPQSAFLTQ